MPRWQNLATKSSCWKETNVQFFVAMNYMQQLCVAAIFSRVVASTVLSKTFAFAEQKLVAGEARRQCGYHETTMALRGCSIDWWYDACDHYGSFREKNSPGAHIRLKTVSSFLPRYVNKVLHIV